MSIDESFCAKDRTFDGFEIAKFQELERALRDNGLIPVPDNTSYEILWGQTENPRVRKVWAIRLVEYEKRDHRWVGLSWIIRLSLPMILPEDGFEPFLEKIGVNKSRYRVEFRWWACYPKGLPVQFATKFGGLIDAPERPMIQINLWPPDPILSDIGGFLADLGAGS